VIIISSNESRRLTEAARGGITERIAQAAMGKQSAGVNAYPSGQTIQPKDKPLNIHSWRMTS
jgi:hypothetical protein